MSKKQPQMITKIHVSGNGVAPKIPQGDVIWDRASIDDGPWRDTKITIRTFLHDGHPLTVYINGAKPLYPTVVYNELSELLAVDVGLLGVRAEEV